MNTPVPSLKCLHFLLVAIDTILLKIAGNELMRNILDEFEFRSDWITDNIVSCP